MLLVGDFDTARDVAQESFARLYERWGSIRSIDHARRFVFTVAMNLGRSHLRRRRRLDLFGLRPLTELQGNQADEAERVERRLLIRGALSRLSARQRACVVLVDYAGFHAVSAAKILGIRPGTAYVHLARGRRLLSSELESVFRKEGL